MAPPICPVMQVRWDTLPCYAQAAQLQVADAKCLLRARSMLPSSRDTDGTASTWPSATCMPAWLHELYTGGAFQPPPAETKVSAIAASGEDSSAEALAEPARRKRHASAGLPKSTCSCRSWGTEPGTCPCTRRGCWAALPWGPTTSPRAAAAAAARAARPWARAGTWRRAASRTRCAPAAQRSPAPRGHASPSESARKSINAVCQSRKHHLILKHMHGHVQMSVHAVDSERVPDHVLLRVSCTKGFHKLQGFTSASRVSAKQTRHCMPDPLSPAS